MSTSGEKITFKVEKVEESSSDESKVLILELERHPHQSMPSLEDESSDDPKPPALLPWHGHNASSSEDSSDEVAEVSKHVSKRAKDVMPSKISTSKESKVSRVHRKNFLEQKKKITSANGGKEKKSLVHSKKYVPMSLICLHF